MDGMLRRFGVVLLWILATLGTATLTYAAVSQAGGAVGDAPAAPVASAEIAARVSTTSTTTVAPGSTTTVVPETTAAVVPETTAAVVPETTTTAAAASTSTTPQTTSSIVTTTTAAATTTTVSAPHTEWKTVTGVGSVAVSVSGNTVAFVAAQPVAPFGVSVEESGPERVEVKFEAEDVEWRVRAEAEGGVVRWEVESDDD